MTIISNDTLLMHSQKIQFTCPQLTTAILIIIRARAFGIGKYKNSMRNRRKLILKIIQPSGKVFSS